MAPMIAAIFAEVAETEVLEVHGDGLRWSHGGPALLVTMDGQLYGCSGSQERGYPRAVPLGSHDKAVRWLLLEAIRSVLAVASAEELRVALAALKAAPTEGA